jgi:hypothetical protein
LRCGAAKTSAAVVQVVALVIHRPSVTCDMIPSAAPMADTDLTVPTAQITPSGRATA